MRSWCGCLDTLYDDPFNSLLSIFSLIFLFILLFFTFFFHVGDKNPAHSCEWGPWHPCRERSSHKMPVLGRPDILWSMNKLARAITKARHSSHMRIQTTLSCGKYSTTIQIRIASGLSFCWRSGRLKIDLRGILCIFGSHTFVPVSWMCKKQTSVSHSFTEAELIFSWCSFTHGWKSSSWSLGFGYRSVSFFSKPTQQHQRSSARKLVAWYHIKQAHPTQNQGFQPNTTILI